MVKPKIPDNEEERQQALNAYKVLDTLPSLPYDNITEAASKICNTPIALISLVDKDRQWFKSKKGLEVSETSRDASFCAHAINNPEELFEVKDATQDIRFKDNPLVIGAPNIKYYLGAPLVTPEGKAIGTLCVIDNKAREISPDTKMALQSLSKQVVCKLELRKQYSELEIINDQLKDEIEIRKRKEEELTIARDKAIEGERIKDEFLSNMSHEIRTPMNGIIGITNLLLGDRSLSNQQMELMQDLDFSANHLLRVINDILDLAKINQNKLKFKPIDFNFQEFMDKLHRLLSVDAKQKRVDLILNTDEKIPTFLNGDRDRLGQIILNIAGNAIKFTNEGIVNIYAKLLAIKASKIVLHFEIKDTGIGIPEGQLEQIFDPFTQQDSGISRRFGGTGLGLSISKNLVEQFGGTIKVESTVGVGSSFKFNVEMSPANTTLEKKAKDFNFPQNLNWANSLHILIVEDNKVNQKIAQKYLERFGFNFKIVDNGLKALEILTQQSFDLILMDVNMPLLDGLEATRRIRKSNSSYKEIKIIAWTASVRNDDTQKCKDAGMDDFISKPFKPKELYQKIYDLTQN